MALLPGALLIQRLASRVVSRWSYRSATWDDELSCWFPGRVSTRRPVNETLRLLFLRALPSHAGAICLAERGLNAQNHGDTRLPLQQRAAALQR